MGVGANPTTWLVAVVFLILAIGINAFANGEDSQMKTTTIKAQVAFVTKHLTKSLITTFRAIAAAVVTDLVTNLIHAKGAPQSG